MKTPCEIVIWHILPAIRRELTRNLVTELGLNQRQTAQLLGMTDAAVSQYLSGKRAKLSINNEAILDEIAQVARQIHNGEDLTTAELCRICTKLRKLPEIVAEFGSLQCSYPNTDGEDGDDDE